MKQSSEASISPRSSDPVMRRVAIPIGGFSLGGCGAEQIERALRSLSGVADVYVNRANEVAYVTFNADEVESAALCRSIQSAGFRTGSAETWWSLR